MCQMPSNGDRNLLKNLCKTFQVLVHEYSINRICVDIRMCLLQLIGTIVLFVQTAIMSIEGQLLRPYIRDVYPPSLRHRFCVQLKAKIEGTRRTSVNSTCMM